MNFFLKSIKNLLKKNALKWLSFWPPYLGAGIRIKYISQDFKEIKVEMKQYFWNSNYVGTHFGGSLYSMVDPFYMLMMIQQLGSDFIVWDKEATIKFIRPGKKIVKAHFKLEQNLIDHIKNNLKPGEKILPQFLVTILDEQGDLIAEINKTLYIRKKVKGLK